MTHVRLFTVDADLADCEMAKKRKTEVNLFSPDDLMKIFGPAALDESSASIPLKELLISQSKQLAAFTVKNCHDAANILSEKPSRRLGGRRRLALEEKKFFEIARSVEQEFPRCECGFELLRRFRNNGITEFNALQNELRKEQLSAVEIESLLAARTPMGAAKLVVARSLPTQKKPKGLSPRTVHSSYSRYLRSKLPSV
jgi:hypothetical protein